jgi:hypothetical protein
MASEEGLRPGDVVEYVNHGSTCNGRLYILYTFPPNKRLRAGLNHNYLWADGVPLKHWGGEFKIASDISLLRARLTGENVR